MYALTLMLSPVNTDITGNSVDTTSASFQLIKNAVIMPPRNIVMSWITSPAWVPIPA